jgi:glycosyltransferase involved in cell wall biosynthesis
MSGAVPMISVLLATRNGAEFLSDQLDSLALQSYGNWRLQASDDGSSDSTLAMLETFSARVGTGRVAISAGPGRGATANFLELILKSGPEAGWLAFCDQDDIWLSEKLERAVAALCDAAGPAIYACRVFIADQGGRGDRISAMPGLPLGLRHALAENGMTGNAMVLNAEAAALMRRAIGGSQDRAALEAGYHDWLAYQVISAAGGAILFDPVPGLHYRQHGGNLVGSGQAKGQALARIRRVLSGDYGRAVRRQATALLSLPDLGDEGRMIAFQLLSLREVSIWKRPAILRRLGIYRQNRAEDWVLKLLLFWGRI